MKGGSIRGLWNCLIRWGWEGEKRTIESPINFFLVELLVNLR